jgi:SNF2 family DNA or RNA helicase
MRRSQAPSQLKLLGQRTKHDVGSIVKPFRPLLLTNPSASKIVSENTDASLIQNRKRVHVQEEEETSLLKKRRLSNQTDSHDEEEAEGETSSTSMTLSMNPTFKKLTKAFKCPLRTLPDNIGLTSPRSNVLGVRRRNYLATRPLHDPDAEDAIILYAQDDGTPVDGLKRLLGLHINESDKEVHVVVDPMLAKVLRPHQIEGVRFLYECTTGLKVENAYGCIMADEMGLGKTVSNEYMMR